ncbi:unnamed protein product [Symbiodinium sp. CCMP2592]|nr:unnamed protein product [Symbiodinium sp. CCMP2592]
MLSQFAGNGNSVAFAIAQEAVNVSACAAAHEFSDISTHCMYKHLSQKAIPEIPAEQRTAAWIHEMLDPAYSLNAKVSKLPRPKPLRATYPEGPLRPDWSGDVVWVHEMLDSIYSFTSKEAKLKAQPMGARYPESCLQVKSPGDATWVHEMLDSAYSFTSKEAKLNARPLGARYPESCLQVKSPSDATWVHEMLDSAYSFTSQEPIMQFLALRRTCPGPERPLQANWTGVGGGLMPVHNSTPAWSQSRSKRMPGSVSMSPGPGSYGNPEYLSFEKYMPDRLQKVKDRKERGRRIAERAVSREAERQGLARPRSARSR